MRTRAILFLAALGIGVAMMPTRAQQPGDLGRDDELVILQLRIEAERARAKEAESRLKQAMISVARIERLHERAAVSEYEVGQARGELEIRKAQLQVQQIAVKEAEVRLQQVKRSQARGEQQRGLTEPEDQGKEELVLLGLRIEAKRAQVREAEVRLNQTMRTLANMLRGHSCPSKMDMDHAQIEVEVRKAQLEAQQIELKEAEVRFQQGKRQEPSPTSLKRRQDEMDRKLDLILKELEDLKGRR